VSALDNVASVGAIIGGLVLPLGGIGVWTARKWIHEQIVSKLSNDDTPVAKYAHDARDYAKEARDTSQNAFDAVMQMHQILTDHVNDPRIHRVHE
jgi:hypothetical protein